VKFFSDKRSIGMWTAWAAAYALVLNVILSSAFLAALSPTTVAAGYELCADSTDAQIVRDDAGKTDKRAAIHCPICVGSHAGAALPPPGALSFERSAITAPLTFAFTARSATLSRTYDHQARGPPRPI
jgi:DUF2946 family protein